MSEQTHKQGESTSEQSDSLRAFVIDMDAKPPEVVASTSATGPSTFATVIQVMEVTWPQDHFVITVEHAKGRDDPRAPGHDWLEEGRS